MSDVPTLTDSIETKNPQKLNVEFTVKPSSPKKYTWVLTIAAPLLAFALGTGAGTLFDFIGLNIEKKKSIFLEQGAKDNREIQKSSYIKAFLDSRHPEEQISIVHSLVASYGVKETLEIEEWLRNSHSVSALLQIKKTLENNEDSTSQNDANLINQSLENLDKVIFIDAFGKRYCEDAANSTRTNIDDIVPNLSDFPMQVYGFKISNPAMSDEEIRTFANTVHKINPQIILMHYSSFEGDLANGTGVNTFLTEISSLEKNSPPHILVYSRTDGIQKTQPPDTLIDQLKENIVYGKMVPGGGKNNDCFAPGSANMLTLRKYLIRYLYNDVNYTTQIVE